MDLELPAGFTDLLQEFTIHVLQDKPEDIVEFAANYFMKLKLKEKRAKDGTKRKSKGVSFHSEEGSDDENSDDEDDEEIGILNTLYSFKFADVNGVEISILRKKFNNPMAFISLPLRTILHSWIVNSHQL